MTPNLDLLHIETTTKCNLRCRHCAINKPGYVHAEMEWSTFSALLTAVSCHSPWVRLNGHGETLTHPDFVAMFEHVSYAKPRGIEFQTNGLLLTPDIVKRLIATKAWQKLTVSIDGATPETYRWVRGASLARLMDNLLAFCEIVKGGSPSLAIEFCAMRRNIADLPDVADMCREFGAAELIVGDLAEYGEMEGQNTLRDWAAVEPYYREAQRIASNAGYKFSPSAKVLGLLGSGVPGGQPSLCRIPWSAAFVDCAGNVRPCCKVEQSFGNVNDASFEDIWTGERATEFRAEMERGELCPECRACTWA